MKYDTARVIITLDCPGSCWYCCNKQEGALDRAREIPTLDEIFDCVDYENVVITGGEPLGCIDRTFDVLHGLSDLRKEGRFGTFKLYLYTAIYDSDIDSLLPYLDGITYGLHAPEVGGDLSVADLNDFLAMQWLAFNKPSLSWRLWINAALNQVVPLIPSAWDRIVVANPQVPTCPVPDNEDLYILADDFK